MYQQMTSTEHVNPDKEKLSSLFDIPSFRLVKHFVDPSVLYDEPAALDE